MRTRTCWASPYYNTSMAIFEEKIADNTGSPLGPSAATVGGVVLKHEAGHNLGLVANRSPMQTEHQDEPNGKHCDDPDCLMYWSVRTLDFIASLTGTDRSWIRTVWTPSERTAADRSVRDATGIHPSGLLRTLRVLAVRVAGPADLAHPSVAPPSGAELPTVVDDLKVEPIPRLLREEPLQVSLRLYHALP